MRKYPLIRMGVIVCILWTWSVYDVHSHINIINTINITLSVSVDHVMDE